MSEKPLRKKFAETFQNGFGAAAFTAVAALGVGTGFYQASDGEIDLEHNAHRDQVISVLDQRFNQLDALESTHQDLQHQYDIAKLDNNLNERHRLEQSIDQNARLIRWLSQEYATVLLQSEAINEVDFEDYAKRFQDSGFDDNTGIKIDPEYAPWRNEMREQHLPLKAEYNDYYEMAEAMQESHADRANIAFGFGFLAIFPALISTIFLATGLERWKKLPNNPKTSSSGSTASNWRRRRHNH